MEHDDEQEAAIQPELLTGHRKPMTRGTVFKLANSLDITGVSLDGESQTQPMEESKGHTQEDGERFGTILTFKSDKIPGSGSAHSINLTGEDDTKEDRTIVDLTTEAVRTSLAPQGLLLTLENDTSVDEEQSSSTEYSMLVFRMKSKNLRPNYPPVFGECNLLYTFVKDLSGNLPNEINHEMSCRLVSKEEMLRSLPGGYTDWPMHSICTKAFEYCDRFSQWEERWTKSMWNVLGKPKSGQLIKLLIGGPPRGDLDGLGRDTGFEAYVFLFFYTASKVAMKKKISLEWFEWKTIDHFFTALNEFGWRVGELNYDGTEIVSSSSSPWRFPVKKHIRDLLLNDLAP